ncbi:hypothetical protein BGW41_002782 [Actinomortierella wolfii]|nr:hypothetical protein BGW41_002782 [Actinomortierella wolfii]
MGPHSRQWGRQVRVLFASSEETTAMMIRRIGDGLVRQIEEAARAGLRREHDGWRNGDEWLSRDWLNQQDSTHERFLSAFQIFNPFSVQAILSLCPLREFLGMSTQQRQTLLETLQHGTSATLGISRRSLLAAISSAKILHVLKGSAGPNDAFTALLDKYTNLGVYVIHHSFTLAELFTIAGLQLASNTITVSIKAAEESVRIIDGLFGSTETSRALAAVVGLVRREICDDDDFALAKAGKMTILAAITKALTVFACLQAATHKRTQKSVRMQLLYEGVVIAKPRKNHLLSIAGHTVDMRTGVNHIHDTNGSTTSDYYDSEEDVDEEFDDDDPELLKDLSSVLETDPVDVTQDMTTTQIERVLSADILQVTTTQTLTTTTTQTFVRPGADLSLLGKPLPVVRNDDDDTLDPNSFQGTLETTSSTRGATSSLSIRTRSRRGSVSSIASVATLTQYATTSIATIPSMTPKDDRNESQHRRSLSTTREYTSTPGTLNADANRQASNNLRLMFTTVTRKFKKNQKLQMNSEANGPHVFVRTQEREIRTSEGAESLEWSEDDTDWIEVTKSTESSTLTTDSITYDVPYDPQLQVNGGTSRGSNGFMFNQGSSSRSLGKSLLSKMSKQPTFLKNGRKGKRNHQQDTIPQMTITEVDEPKNDSSSSSSSSTSSIGKESKFVNDSSEQAPPVPSKDSGTTPPPLPPKEPKEPHPENFPRDHLVRNIQRFMRYASASYGHNFMRILGIGIIGDTVYSPYGDHPNHHAFAAHTNIPLDSILLSSFTDPANKTFNAPKMHSLVHYLNLDHAAKCVVLTCRGTLGLSDVLTDLCAHYDDLILPTLNPEGKGDDDAFKPGAKYQVHAGMHASARLLANEGSTVFKTIKKALEDYPDYGLVLCGHSLGGGVVGILAVLLSMLRKDFESYLGRYGGYEVDEEAGDIGDGRKMYRTRGRKNGRPQLVFPELTTPFVTSVSSGLPPGRPIHCYAFASPCIMSLPLSRYCRGLVTTVVYQYDIVPTLSLGLLKDFKNVAVTLYEEGQVVEDIVKRLIMGITSKEKRNNDAPHMSTADYMASATYTSQSTKTSTTTTTTMNGSQSTSVNTYLYSEYDRWQLQEAEDQDWSWSLIKTMRADMSSEKLYPPSPVYLLESIATTIPGDAADPIRPKNSGNGQSMALTTTKASPICPPPSPRVSEVGMNPSYSMSSPSLVPNPTPPPRSLTSMAFSTATSAAASLASHFSPFQRSSTPTPTSSNDEQTSTRRQQQPGRANGASNMKRKKEGKSPSVNGKTGPKKAYKVTMRRLDHVEDRFSEIQFARTMFTDHSPANYEDCVERLVQTVFGAQS